MTDVSGYKNKSVATRKRAEDLILQADECREKAREAIGNGSSVAAREWFEAAEAALRAARATGASAGSEA